ncbi:hypothetical protein B0H14DRAFT_930236 [Mycena olivaceomarginata]|nr:hypothetical protein B0H14DRAFT_930236 [Mycena olivaceomarginata]
MSRRMLRLEGGRGRCRWEADGCAQAPRTAGSRRALGLTQGRRLSPSASDSRPGLHFSARTPRLHANVPLPISAVVTRIVHPCGGAAEGLLSPSRPTPPFSRACASAAPAPCPPLGAPLKRRPPPHALIASAASPWLGAPHLRHIHRRLPSAAASHPRSRRSALPPQVCCRWEGWEGYGGSLYAQLAGKWEEGSLRTARGAMVVPRVRG